MHMAKILTLCLAGAVAMTGCATRGQLKRGLAQQQAMLDAERAQRMSADSAYAAQLGAVQTDVASLRTDLQNLRTEFGAKITAMENGVKVTFPVNFAFDDATVRAEDQPAIEKFADVAEKHFTGSVITVEGFADPAGTQAYNLELSRRRADAVRSMLLSKGMNAQQIRAIGYGKTRLVVPNASHDAPGAEQNRRVVFVIESKGTDAQTTASAF
jgi:outer membrane protein OmpA-like peptidoglycan-associated protein